MSERQKLGISDFTFYLVAAVAIGLHLFYVLAGLSNIPNGQDFELFLDFLNSWYASGPISEKIELLFSSRGGHPRIFGRLLALFCWSVWGELNFSFIILVGNLLLILSFFILILGAGWTEQKSKSIFLVVPLMIFNPQFMREFMWASGAVGSVSVVFFSILAIYFATRAKHNAFSGSLMCSILAAFSGITGMLTPLISGIYFLIRRKSLSGLFFVLIGFLIVYLLLPGLSESGSSHVEPILFLNYLTGYFGSVAAMQFDSSVLYGSLFVAAFLCLVGPLAVIRPFISASLLFLFLMAVINGLTEQNFAVENSFHETRYRLVTSFFIALLWLGLIYNLKTISLSRHLSFLAFWAGLAFSSMSYLRFTPYFDLRKTMLEDSVVRYQVAGFGLLYPDQERARKIAFTAERNGVYTFPQIEEKSLEMPPVKEKLKVRRGRIVHKFEHVIVSSSHVFIDGYAFLANMDNYQADIRLRLKSGKGNVYTMALNLRDRPDLVEKFKRSDVGQAGFFGMLNRDELPVGVYRVFILIGQHGSNYYSDTGIELILSKETPV